MKRRLPMLARWLGGVCLAWSLLVFFGTLRSEGDAHEWWPIFLYPLIWPVSALYERLASTCLDWWVPDPRTAPAWVWILNDYLAGAFYIVIGTIWILCLGWMHSTVAARVLAASGGSNK